MSVRGLKPRRQRLRQDLGAIRITAQIEQEVQRILARWAVRAVIAAREATQREPK